jgi:hypothetical protein
MTQRSTKWSWKSIPALHGDNVTDRLATKKSLVQRLKEEWRELYEAFGCH